MKSSNLAICSVLGLSLTVAVSSATEIESAEPVLVLHGGAGTILKAMMSPERESEYRETLRRALEAGYFGLLEGGTSLDAVETVIRILEDSPLFNAGKGAVFTAEERNELDASIMDGATLEAGAVAGVRTIKNPISAARAVMEQSVHVMLTGTGAESFARSVGLTIVDPSYFYTERRWKALQNRKKEESEQAQFSTEEILTKRVATTKYYLGTVGAIALDRRGHLAAGTSTGGITFKRHGRIGDSPIIGAGTYANEHCAVSATGHGEFFIRLAIAHDICARVAYKDETIEQASHTVIHESLTEAGGTGGVIALDQSGNIAMPFNTAGMYRGVIRDGGKMQVEIYK